MCLHTRAQKQHPTSMRSCMSYALLYASICFHASLCACTQEHRSNAHQACVPACSIFCFHASSSACIGSVPLGGKHRSSLIKHFFLHIEQHACMCMRKPKQRSTEANSSTCAKEHRSDTYFNLRSCRLGILQAQVLTQGKMPAAPTNPSSLNRETGCTSRPLTWHQQRGLPQAQALG
eukprot:scaffold51741_cov19-Tisochrysis_lutea.AAC.2